MSRALTNSTGLRRRQMTTDHRNDRTTHAALIFPRNGDDVWIAAPRRSDGEILALVTPLKRRIAGLEAEVSSLKAS